MYKTTKNHPYLKEGLEVNFTKKELGTRTVIYFRDEVGELITFVMVRHIENHPDWFEEVKDSQEEKHSLSDEDLKKIAVMMAKEFLNTPICPKTLK